MIILLNVFENKLFTINYGGDILISKRLIALLFNGLDGENAEFFDDVNKMIKEKLKNRGLCDED